MDILSLIPLLYDNLVVYILALTRISFLFATFILFNKAYVNRKLLISLSTILAYYALLISHTPLPKYEMFSLPMMNDLLMQAFVGFIIGFVLNVIFEVFTAVGQIISTQIGLSMVTLFDPRLGSVTALAIFYNYVAIVMFMLMNGHLIVIKMLLDSFTIIPIGHLSLSLNVLHMVIFYINSIFTSAVSLSLAIIISMLLTNLTIAMVTRFAPQFNIFTIGVNLTLVGGLAFVYFMFNLFVSNGNKVFSDGLLFLGQVVSGMK